MLRSLTLATALAAVLLVPRAASADGDHRHHYFHRHFHGYALHGYHARHYWGGRWWAYGVGSCWRWSEDDEELIWVCD